MHKIINYYIFREMTAPFILTVIILTFTSLLSKVFKLVELTVAHGVGLPIVFKFLAFTMPSFLIYIIPISFLISVLIAYNRLSSDNEITAMKASGLNILMISRPVVVMAIIAYLLSAFFMIYAFPLGNISSKRLIYDVVRSKATIGLKEKVFNNAFEGLTLYVNRITPGSDNLEGIFLSDNRNENGASVITAKNGIISSDKEKMNILLRLFNGTIHSSGEKGVYRVINFSTYDLNLSLKNDKAGDPDTSRTNRDLTIKQLRERIDQAKQEGSNTAPYIIDMHKRFALPASVLVFGLLAVPLGIHKVRTTRFTSFSIALGIVLIYYVISTAFESLGEKGMVNPVLAVWGSDILMALSGIYIFYKTAKESPIKSLMWFGDVIDNIGSLLKKRVFKDKQ